MATKKPKPMGTRQQQKNICLHLECMTGFSNNDRPLLLFSFEFSTKTLIYAWIILKTELTLIITNYEYILAGVKGMHRPVDASQ